MANYYRNAFYAPTTTSVTSVYACPSNSRAIIQNIQITNESGSKNVKVSVTDSSASTNVQIAYAAINGPTICNLASGPIILEESDSLSIETSNISTITAIVSILEMNRNDQNG
jgi:predicted solute-binding protein